MNRREVLKASGGTTVMALMISVGLLKSGDAAAQEWNKNAFEAKNLNDTVKALGGTAATESKDITFVNAPDIAENGAVVRFGAQARRNQVPLGRVKRL